MSLVCVDEHRLLRDIERLLRREIPRVVLDGYAPDPGIRAEPIPNGRNGKGRSGDKRTPPNARHKHVRRKSGDTRSQPQHRHPRPGQGRKRAAQA